MSKHYLTGRRIICQSIIPGYNLVTNTKECRVLEVSPTCEWIKLMNDKNIVTWESMAEVRIVELLDDK